MLAALRSRASPAVCSARWQPAMIRPFSSTFVAQNSRASDALEALASFVEQPDTTPASSTGPRLRGDNPPGTAFYEKGFYNPHDLLRSRRQRAPVPRRHVKPLGPPAKEARANDVFRQLKIDPVREARNGLLLSHFVTEMGKIKPRGSTGLTWWSQRKVGKAIRRARNMGVIPLFRRDEFKERY